MKRSHQILIALCFLAAFVIFRIGDELFGSVAIASEQRSFVIAPGMTVKQVSARLAAAGVIKSDFLFRTYVWAMKTEKGFQAGTFILPEKASVLDLVELFTMRAHKEVGTIKILEGWGIADIERVLSKQGLSGADSLSSIVGSEANATILSPAVDSKLASDFPILASKPTSAPLEGYLFPDTYEIFADASADDVVYKMLSNFSKKLTPPLLQEIERQGKSLYDVLIMASIIEAEVPHEEDRAIVSDIFWSRLASGVALQSDATLNYAIGGGSPSLTRDQLKIDSPYNTYLYRGLPPTPVGNPGLSAIRAAIYPAETDYFYFLSTPEGKTVFSRTLDEHNAAKAKYLR